MGWPSRDFGMKARLREIAISIETWAAVSYDRVQLLVVLVLLAFGLLALMVIAIFALAVLPPETWSL
jgi:hypothetical protein